MSELPPAADETNPAANSPQTPADDPSHVWLRTVYQGDRVRQLSVRSVVTGMLIGGVMSISNLYVGLKTGWGLGVTITAAIIAYSVFQLLERLIPAWKNDHFTILENYTMSSAASAAGYMSSAGLVSSIPALYLATGRQLTWWELMPWMAALSTLGVFMAIPMKRQMVNIEQLPFPAGTATAETLKSMHTSGEEAILKARSLLVSGIIGVLIKLAQDAASTISKLFGLMIKKVNPETGVEKLAHPDWVASASLPSELPFFPGEYGKKLLEGHSMGLPGSAVLLAAGAIMGIRVGVTLLFGAILYYVVIGTWLIQQGVVAESDGYGAITKWTLWPATSLMVTSGLLSFAMRWKTIIRSFTSLSSMIFPARAHQHDPLDDIEVPDSWFLWGTFLSGAACVILGVVLFQIEWWMGVIAVLMTFFLSIVAARATGETDITPIGAMGKITQLAYAWIHPANMTTNLMTANVTAGAASHCADLLTDLKTGYLLGGNPRKQLISQLFGVLAGTLFSVPIYLLVVKPEELGGNELPAPAAKVWAAVTKLLAEGVQNLPKYAVPAIIIGAVLGVVITLAEELLPKRFRKFIPSTTGLGIAGVISGVDSIAMFIGALIAFILSKVRPDLDEKYTIPVSSGLIAGETLMGVGLILLSEGPGLIQRLFGW